MTWSEEIHKMLNDNKLTVKAAAERCEVPYRTFQDWKLGKSEPKLPAKIEIRRELNGIPRYELPSTFRFSQIDGNKTIICFDKESIEDAIDDVKAAFNVVEFIKPGNKASQHYLPSQCYRIYQGIVDTDYIAIITI